MVVEDLLGYSLSFEGLESCHYVLVDYDESLEYIFYCLVGVTGILRVGDAGYSFEGQVELLE